MEPLATAWLLVVVGVLLAAGALFSRVSARFGLPIFLLFLTVGMVAGSEGLGGIAFEDYHQAFRLGSVALALILFDGGLNTPVAAVKRTLGPSAVLATAGVVGTGAVVAVGARLLGLDWIGACLVGAVVSSTDAAAVLSVLRANNLHLRRRVGMTLELESGLNDPVAVILTGAVTLVAAGIGDGPGWGLAVDVVLQLAVGAAAGLALGLGGRRLLRWARLPASGLYSVLTLALALLAFGLPTLFHGSGFLAVYVAGIVIGHGGLPYRTGLLRFHDALAWLCQVGMFLMLGLLVFPSRLLEVATVGTGIGLVLAFVARPAVAALCLLPFGFRLREMAYIGWVGLRGAVPIVLATMPVMLGVPRAERLFDLVFFVVVVTALVPGATVPWVTRRLGLSEEVPRPRALLEITSAKPLKGEVLAFAVHPAVAVAGAAIADLPIPERAVVMLLMRGDELIAPRGATVLEPGDHVHVFCPPEDRELVRLIFGAEAEG